MNSKGIYLSAALNKMKDVVGCLEECDSKSLEQARSVLNNIQSEWERLVNGSEVQNG